MQKLGSMREALHGKKEKLKEKKEKLKDKVGGRANTFKVWKMTDDQLDQYFTKKYLDELESNFKTGDIILSRGTEAVSQLIRKGTMSTWSHAAMIVVDPSPAVREAYKIDEYYHEDVNERVFIFESDTVTQDKRPGGGTQLFPFKRWMKCCIDEYSDSYLVVHRSLKHPEEHNGKHHNDVFNEFEKFMLEMCKRSYEHSRVQLMFSAIHTNKKEDLSTVFCSELVAASLKSMRLLHETSNSNNFVPRDFTSNQRLDGADMKLQNGFCFEKEVRIRIRPNINPSLTSSTLPTSSIAIPDHQDLNKTT